MRLVLPSIEETEFAKLPLFSHRSVPSVSSLSFHGSPPQQVGEFKCVRSQTRAPRSQLKPEEALSGRLDKVLQFPFSHKLAVPELGLAHRNMLFGLYLVSVKFFQQLAFECRELGIMLAAAGTCFAYWNSLILQRTLVRSVQYAKHYFKNFMCMDSQNASTTQPSHCLQEKRGRKHGEIFLTGVLKLGDGEIIWSVKCQPHNHADLGSDSQHSCKI